MPSAHVPYHLKRTLTSLAAVEDGRAAAEETFRMGFSPIARGHGRTRTSFWERSASRTTLRGLGPLAGQATRATCVHGLPACMPAGLPACLAVAASSFPSALRNQERQTWRTPSLAGVLSSTPCAILPPYLTLSLSFTLFFFLFRRDKFRAFGSCGRLRASPDGIRG